MNKSNKLLSDIVSFRTYARYLPELNRRESLEETINRNMNMHLQKFPKLSKDILKAYEYVHDLKVMPSMRSLQFGGDAILKNNTRIYNCSFLNINYIRAFAEAFYLLLCGTGVGYSVQSRHISKLPAIRKPKREETYVINDSVEGWAESVDRLVNAYFYGSIKPIFDYSRISPKDTQLATIGAKAPGHEPLKKMLETVDRMLAEAIGRKLRAIECHDLMCIISDAVLAGGIRRAALIALFDKSDKEMLTCKHGEWWVKHPHRARANNSAVLDYETTTQEEFNYIFDMCIKSNSGEPGFSWSHNTDMGFNPSLRGSTRVWTKEFGIVPIKELEGKNFTVKNLYGKEVPATCWLSSPKEKLLRLTLSGGFEYYATKEHKWAVLVDGGVVKLETPDLKPGMKLPRLREQKIRDGGFGTYEQGKNQAMSLTPGNIMPLFEFMFLTASDDYITGFIENFCEVLEGEELETMHDLLAFKGIYTDKEDGELFLSEDQDATIISVEQTDIEEPVWDIRVDDETHCFQLAGCITGNCHEISLNSNQVCNLTTTNLTGANTEQKLLTRVKYASLLGTLQASYTDFPYLNSNWREVTEREALLGVSFTGIADAGNFATAQMLSKAAKVVLDTNEEYARKIGINLAARATAIKPEGSSSCVLGSSSGVHARFDQYYLRRVRMNSNDDLAQYLIKTCPELVEKDLFSTTGIVVTIPQESPAGSILRQNESALDLFNRVKLYNSSWVAGGHRSGDNKHNVSCTINYKPEEIEELKLRMWEDRHSYSGISLLPADDTSYSQMPFESCDKKTFDKYNEMVGDIDLTKVSEVVNNTNVTETVACGGGSCEIV